VTSKIEKYVIHCDPATGTWWARVPYGTFQPFENWQAAAGFLRLRHHLRTEGKTWRRR
jgi:hypothetical protein